MGILKNILGKAVEKGISSGISKGISDAVRSVAAPAAEKIAKQATGGLQGLKGSFASAVSALNDAAKAAEAASKNTNTQQPEPEAQVVIPAVTVTADYDNVPQDWETYVPGFPVWCYGGSDFSFEENGADPDGNIYYYFNVHNTRYEALEAYLALLKQNGFLRVHKDTDETLYKPIGGEYLVVNITEAFYSDTEMSIALFRTRRESEFMN